MAKYDAEAIRNRKFFQPTPQQITAFVAKHFPNFKPRKDGTELRICSPFDDDDDFKFNISTRGFCHDWRSDDWAGAPSPKTGKYNRSFVRFVQVYLDCSYRSAIRAITDSSSQPLGLNDYRRPEREEVVEKPLVTMPDGAELLIADGEPNKLQKLLLGWLASRGITSDDIKRFNIHYLASSVIWPYYEFDVLVYWQMRNRLNKQFLFPDEQTFGVSKGQFLYNFDQVEPASELVITESIFNCYTIREQCVATGGASLAPEQIKKINLLGPRQGIILAPDNDEAGLKSVVHNAKLLANSGWPLYYSVPPRYQFIKDGEMRYIKDWNELLTDFKMSKKHIREKMVSRIKPYNILNKVAILKEINDLRR